MVIGASANMNSVMDFSDMMILGMSFPNILGLYILAPEIKADLKIYIEKLRTITPN
jgi:AGCS family alanine or glycine:cation symporter